MIGLDTNVLVRYLVQDDPTQTRPFFSISNCLPSSIFSMTSAKAVLAYP